MPSLTDTLIDDRIQLHYAIQFIAATGAALAPPQPDYSHTALGWNAEQQWFTGVPISTPDGEFVQIGIDPTSLTLLVLNADADAIAHYSLIGQTLNDGLIWLKAHLQALGLSSEAIAFLSYPPDDFPDHALAQGATFTVPQSADYVTLIHTYDQTYHYLQTVVDWAIHHQLSPSAVRIWPHHFDMAILITVPTAPSEPEKTVGVGFSPGDTSYPDPYWYVSPYPYPAITNLPDLQPPGHWHTAHWVGAVLRSSDLSESPNAIHHFLITTPQQAVSLL